MCHEGIPDEVRGVIWTKVFDIEAAKNEHSYKLYSKLCEFPNEKACSDIKKDVDRTMSQLELWDQDLQCGNNKLFNVLKAYANYDNEVGYVQGMNFIVAMLLFYISDEESVFWCLYQLMVKFRYRQIYKQDFPKLIQLSTYLEKRLRAEHPDLLEHLERNSMVIRGTFTGHIMTFGLNCCPMEVCVRLFEIFILDGEIKFIKVLMRMLELKKEKILSKIDTEL